MEDEYVLELSNIRKEYPGVVALKNVSLRLKKGEILALIGENGAGKSTLIKTCSGAVVPSSGTIKVNGKTFSAMTPQLADENGIAIIYQEFNNVPELTATENLFLGKPIRKGWVIDNAAMEREAKAAFDQLGVKIDPKALMKNLTVGYQQMVEIAKAIQKNANILIMDEPSAPLTNAEVKNMFAVVRLLQKRGVSIIYISHRLEEIMELTDRIVVIRDGEYIDTLTTKETSIDKMIKLMVGREMSETYPPREDHTDKSAVVLDVQNLCGNGVEGINFKLHKGEVLGFGGLVGAGRTETAEMIFGAAKRKSGKVLFRGKEINPKSPREAIDMGIALIPEDRKRHGALLGLSIMKNINMPIYKRDSVAGVIKSYIERDTAEKYRAELVIKTPALEQLVKNLSGGNQQKVILGKWLAADSELIIFDEPTRGIDVGAKYEIYKLINTLVAEGKSVIMISSEMEELMGMSDRIIVLSEGRQTGSLEKADFNPETIMTMASQQAKSASYGEI